jgi:hypothetical protein
MPAAAIRNSFALPAKERGSSEFDRNNSINKSASMKDERLSSVSFLPWIGDNYEKGRGGRKILVLGDSHYSWAGSGDINQQPECTRDLVEEQISGAYSKRFWTNISATFLNELPSLSQKKEFWHSISFYNYLQSSAGNGANSIPKQDQWKASERPFLEVINTLHPDLVVVLGNRLWNHLPEILRSNIFQFDHSKFSRNACRYNYSTGSILIIHFPHPSRAYNFRDWHTPFMKAIDEASRSGMNHFD